MPHIKLISQVLLGLGLLLTLWNCSNNKPQFKKEKNNVYATLEKKKAKLSEKGVLAEIGIGESQDLGLAINKAELEARARLARSLASKTSSLQKKFAEEVTDELLQHFKQVNKTVADRLLQGSTLIETKQEKNTAGQTRIYGLMVLDYETFAGALEAEMAAYQAMKSRWLASKAYRELDEEVKNFREWKKRETIGLEQSQAM